MQAILNEGEIYDILKDYWEQCVPSLVDLGTSARGSLVFIATTLFDGLEFGKGIPTKLSLLCLSNF